MTERNEICSTPAEFGSAVFLNDNVSKHSGMPSVPIWECVNLPDKAMVKANGYCIKGEGLAFNPVLSISQKHPDSLVDFGSPVKLPRPQIGECVWENKLRGLRSPCRGPF